MKPFKKDNWYCSFCWQFGKGKSTTLWSRIKRWWKK